MGATTKEIDPTYPNIIINEYDIVEVAKDKKSMRGTPNIILNESKGADDRISSQLEYEE